MDYAEYSVFACRVVSISLFRQSAVWKRSQKFVNSYQKHHFLSQESSHRVSYQDYIAIRVFVFRQPAAQVFCGQVECFVRLVPRVNLGVNRMGSCKLLFESHVYMKRERVERGFTPDEAVDVDDQKSPFQALIFVGVRWC